MTSNFLDAPLIVQFAAHTDKEFGDAAELIRSGGHMGGIDLNCGCPQKWAMQEGIGSALLKKPETIKSMVKAAKERAGNLPISIKIRIAHDLRETVRIGDFLKTLSDVCDFSSLFWSNHSPGPCLLQMNFGAALRDTLSLDTAECVHSLAHAHAPSIKIPWIPQVQIVKMAESMGVDFITLHGRTADAKPNSAVDFDAVIASSNPSPVIHPRES